MSINEHLCNEAEQQSVGGEEKHTFDQSAFGSREKSPNNKFQLYQLVTSRYCSPYDASLNADSSVETRGMLSVFWQI